MPLSLQPILVTGGAGFIGSNFVLDWLQEQGTPVVNLDKLTYAANPRTLEPVRDNLLSAPLLCRGALRGRKSC